jgi:hypothetical protein
LLAHVISLWDDVIKLGQNIRLRSGTNDVVTNVVTKVGRNINAKKILA